MLHEFKGDNGYEIAEALNAGLTTANRPESQAVVNPDHENRCLLLHKVYRDGYVAENVWIVPLGFFLNDETGEVTDSSGTVQDYVDLESEYVHS